MLTSEEKQKMIDHRIKQYEVRLFDLQMTREALLVVDDKESLASIDTRIEGINKAIEAVRSMNDADTNNDNSVSSTDI